MKRILAISIFVLFSLSTFSQKQGDLRGLLGVALGTNSGINQTTGFPELGLGLNAGLEYFLTDLVSFAPNYTTYTKTRLGSSKLGFNYMNFDFRYLLNEGDFRFYAFGGVHNLFSRRQVFGITQSTNQLGFNLGIGLNLPLGNALYGNAQLKLQEPFERELSRQGQWVVGFGVAYSFNE